MTHRDNDRLASPSIWREHATAMRRYGLDAFATALEKCAADVEAEERERASARVTLEEAVEITGFSRSHLRRLWRTRRVRPLGAEESPEFYLADLPRKAGYVPENKTLEHDPASDVNLKMQVARAVVKGEL